MDKKETIIGIGWDVGGWQSRKQAIAVASWSTGQSVNWNNNANGSVSIQEFRLTPDNDYDLTKMLKRVGADRFLRDESCQIVIAIDAPLGFPDDFLSFLHNPDQISPVQASAMENQLAYRATERWVFRVHKKRPITPTFDKLTSNATPAMAAVRHTCREYSFKMVPAHTEEPTSRMIIETYPALVKRGTERRLDLRVMPAMAPHLPAGFPLGSDASDAAICALCAIRFGTSGDFLGFPKLIGPQCDEAKTEGWIYSLPANFISADFKEDQPLS